MADSSPPSPAAPQMERFSFVILRTGDYPPQLTEDEATELQKQHLAHLRKMSEAGHLVIAGPLGDQQDKTMRGFCICCEPLDVTKSLAEQDPAVQAGRLRVDVISWYVLKGHMLFPHSPLPATR